MQRYFRSTVMKFLAFTFLSLCMAGTGVGQTATSTQNLEWKVVRHEKDLIVRVVPGTDWSKYREISVGTVRYTGAEINLTPKENAELTGVLRTQLSKDLGRVSLTPAESARGKLVVNAEITGVKRTNGLVNLVSMAAIVIPIDLGRAQVVVWVVDGETQQPVASIEMNGSGKVYQGIASLCSIGQDRLVLKSESRKLARVLGGMGPVMESAQMETSSKGESGKDESIEVAQR